MCGCIAALLQNWTCICKIINIELILYNLIENPLKEITSGHRILSTNKVFPFYKDIIIALHVSQD
jgi:hypothetical protein